MKASTQPCNTTGTARHGVCSLREMLPTKTLADTLVYLARMKGHLKSNGAPRWQTLARGYQRLSALCDGWEAVRNLAERSDQSERASGASKACDEAPPSPSFVMFAA
jgi:hypothetical protein